MFVEEGYNSLSIIFICHINKKIRDITHKLSTMMNLTRNCPRRGNLCLLGRRTISMRATSRLSSNTWISYLGRIWRTKLGSSCRDVITSLRIITRSSFFWEKDKRLWVYSMNVVAKWMEVWKVMDTCSMILKVSAI